MVRFECDLCPRTFRTEAKRDAHRKAEISSPRTPRHGTRRPVLMPTMPDPLVAMMAAAANAAKNEER